LSNEELKIRHAASKQYPGPGNADSEVLAQPVERRPVLKNALSDVTHAELVTPMERSSTAGIT
jgi:hypothetical protein